MNDSRVPSILQPRVELILRWLDALKEDAGADNPDVDPALVIPSQSPSVLSILGQQGVGKSTTLKYVCDELQQIPRRLVTPAVSPERFADDDTLLGWVLSALTEILPEKLPEASQQMVSEYRSNLTIRELADLLRRQEALARKHHQVSSVIRSAHPDEWAESIAAVTTAGLQLVKGWIALLNGLSSAVDQIIIPVDDADQVPSLLSSILRDLRWLTVHPLVAVVVCANEEMLMQSLLGESELAMMEPSARQRHSAGVLTKALPRHLRVSISPLEPPERLHFTPQGETESLLRLLGNFDLEDTGPGKPATLGGMFELELGSGQATSPYADLLPDTARRLDHLWRQLRDILENTEKAEDRPALAAQRLIETALESSLDLTPGLPAETIRIFQSEAQGPSIEFDYSKLETATTVGSGRTVHRTSNTSIVMRRIDGFPLQLAKREDQDGPTEIPENLPSSFSMAHYFGFDLTDPEGSNKSPFYLWGYSNSLGLPGGPNWEGSIDIEHQGEPTDNRFVLIPNWDAKFDYFIYTAGWNAGWNAIKDYGPAPSSVLLEWVLMRHLLLVIAVQEQRSIPASLMDSLREQVNDVDGSWSPEAELIDFADAVDRLYRTKEKRTIREADFATWVDTYLASCADPLLGIPDFGDQLLKTRQLVLEDRGTLEYANQRCSSFLAARVRRRPSADWTVHTIALLERFDPDLAHTLTELHEVAREERDSDLDSLITTLERRGISGSLVGKLTLNGMTPDLEREFRLAGLPSPAIQTLAQRFPARSQEEALISRQTQLGDTDRD